MALVRLRDVGPIVFAVGGDAGCPRSVTIALESEVLRAKCGLAISERYQGITGMSLEATIETLNPLVDVHPGDAEVVDIGIPGTSDTSGVPVPTAGVSITIDGVVTSTTRRFTRNELATGSYTIRGKSSDGIACPISFVIGSTADDGGGPADFVRDIYMFKFKSTVLARADFCPESIEMTEGTELIEDSCQGELWPTYVGITGLNVTVTATGKGVKHGFDAGTGTTTCLGNKGKIEVGVAVGSDDDCASIVPGGFADVNNANVISMTITATHGEIATISLTWSAHGTAGELTDLSKRAAVVIS